MTEFKYQIVGFAAPIWQKQQQQSHKSAQHSTFNKNITNSIILKSNSFLNF